MSEATVAAAAPTRRRADPLSVGVPTALVALAGIGWWWSLRMTADMDGSTGAMAGMSSMSSAEMVSLGSFLVTWVAMMAAMMFPAVAPVVRLYGRAAAAGRVAPLPVFVAGYIAVWGALGLPGYVGWRALMGPVADGQTWAGRFAGVVLIGAAIWQVTPLRGVCLSHCRSPMSFFMRFGKSVAKPLGALRMGATHGLYCVGCCWALMMVLVAMGTMHALWMAGLAVLIFLEKNAPHGERIAMAGALVFLSLGAALILYPSMLTSVT